MRIVRPVTVAGAIVVMTVLAGCSNRSSPEDIGPVHSAATPTPSATTAPTKVNVPDVVGKTRRDAYTALQVMALAPIVTNNEVLYSPPYDQNPIVISQDPAAGAQVDEGTVIHLTLKASSPTPTPTSVAPPPPPDTVVYAVTGSGVDGAGTISYIVPNGTFGQEQANDVALPWSKEIPISGANNVYVLTAQGSGGPGSITCSITVRGRVVSTQTSTGYPLRPPPARTRS